MRPATVAFTQLAEELLKWDVNGLVGIENQLIPIRANVGSGSHAGYCVVSGQKVPLQRPRVATFVSGKYLWASM